MASSKYLASTYSRLFNCCIHTNRRTWSSLAAEGDHKCKVLIVGAGAGGCTVAAKLSSKLGKNAITVLEPSSTHYYQAMFTLIAGGMKCLQQCCYPMKDVMPKNVKWLQESATQFDPENNAVTTSTGLRITYDLLLIAVGLQLNYDSILGLKEALEMPNGKVCTIYSSQYVDKTFQCIQNVKEGNAIFTFPNSPVKCPGAPQKIMYIAEEYFRKTNKRENINIIYNTALPVIFGVKYYADALWKVVEKRDIDVNLSMNLIEVRPESDTAIFQPLGVGGEKIAITYSMLHAVPYMCTPPELMQCTELVNRHGFVDVSQCTLQHVKYKNVFAIGDCASTPNSKTAAAAGAQSYVVANNMMAMLNGKEVTSSYDGYASCPIVTGYHSCIMAEFDYTLQPLETFPFPQDRERYSMFIVKKDLMPILYKYFMLRGLWNGPATVRKIFSIFKIFNKPQKK